MARIRIDTNINQAIKIYPIFIIGKGFQEKQYVLRHSCATRKIEAGMPPEVLKDFLGHRDIDVTLNTYFNAFAAYKNKYNQLSEN